MADVHTKEVRSFNMSQIGSKDTKPEILVRKALHKKGFRFRLHAKDLPGKPDIVLPKYKTVIFINGCFWHGHEGCKKAKLPETRKEWWKKKINRTKERDLEKKKDLERLKWAVIQVYECDLRNEKFEKTILKLIKLIA